MYQTPLTFEAQLTPRRMQGGQQVSREREENAKRDGERRGETTGGGSWRAEGGERNAQKQL